MIASFVCVWGGVLLIGHHGSPEMWFYLLANMGIQKWLFGTRENMHSCHKWLFDKRPFLKRPFEFQGVRCLWVSFPLGSASGPINVPSLSAGVRRRDGGGVGQP